MSTRGYYERTDLIKTRSSLTHARNRVTRMTKQLQDAQRCVKELEAKESELALKQLEAGMQVTRWSA